MAASQWLTIQLGGKIEKMVRAAEWGRIRAGKRRDFIVYYTDDSPERAEAVSFFTSLNFGIYSYSPITDEIWNMSDDKAAAYLETHPVPQTFEAMYSRGRCNEISDEDLARLSHIPELIRIRITSDNLSNNGVTTIVNSLPLLEDLQLNSPLITDNCLTTIAQRKSLRYLSLQSCPLITNDAFDSFVKTMPNIVESWGPLH